MQEYTQGELHHKLQSIELKYVCTYVHTAVGESLLYACPASDQVICFENENKK